METASCVLQSLQWDHEATFPRPVPEAAVESRSQIHLTFIAVRVMSWTLRVIFSVGLSCCPRTICLRVFPLLTLSKICLGNKGGCVSRLQSGPVSACALGLVIVASRRDFRSHVKNFWPFSSENQYWLLHVFCVSIYLLSQLVCFCHQKVCWKFERCLWTQRHLTRTC